MAESDMLSALLNDPHALEQALSTASALLGGSDPPAMPSMSEPSGMPSASPSASANDAYDPSADLMRRAMPVLGRIAQRGQAAVTPQKRALLNAVKPFVGAPIRSQIDRGMRLVSLAYMATAVLGSPDEDTRHV
ncbi:hypothetical protein [Butyricicoccus pullicaecorum]|uniref:Uncharacterized protein n=2 Tax=Butyricicoccus pullicaecorum TaxID=501571 RepID=R8VYC8_9FIRM|nr:hypothetical protein [Butyricicoccus pullicaecorum]EOQ37301.1 hypothetical protein HMPREF1526_01992 [Butyricicoccus pullicaecorum 1.2]OUP59498.1 hypothetical protein B5F15_05455 [Butyricicoccus pullicaecorum]SKA58942.1 hypothetical protein SAMN02745978_01517 [Butyricicoccus pullicaecorum DSM 23266]HJF52777.1 hypothetical protein [Butyricicoccus pullicaecorum]